MDGPPRDPIDHRPVLAAAVKATLADGFRVESQSEFEAVLTRRRWFRSQRRVVQVDAFGNITVTGR